MTNRERISHALRLLCSKTAVDTQSAYAKKTGVAQSYISSIISGKKVGRMTLEMMERLFPELKIYPVSKNGAPDAIDEQIMRMLSQLDDTEKLRLFGFICAKYPRAFETSQSGTPESRP